MTGAKKAGKIPAYRLHKGTGQAVVTLSGHDHYLGRHGTEASRGAYERLVSVWLAGGRRPLGARPGADAPAVAEVLVAYWTWAEKYYRKGGRPTKQLSVLKPCLAKLRAAYGPEPAAEFGPLKLRAFRESLVAAGYTRRGVNRRVRLVAGVFRWAAAEELVPGPVYQALAAVSGLKLGRTTAPETEPVGPAPAADVEATLKVLRRPQYRTMIRLQLLTGMRPGEVITMRACDVDTSGAVWVYTPEGHKTEHHGKARVVYLGPRAQAELGPWLARGGPADRHLFRPEKGPNPFVPPNTYAAIVRGACDRAGVPRWHPNQLRHAAATAIRRECGLEAARVILGHSTVTTTELYAERDAAKAVEVVGRIG